MKAFDSLLRIPCHLQKGLPIIVTTLLGIVILVRELQRLNVLLVDYQYYTL